MGDGNQRHILVIEDEPVIACLLADVFGGSGYRVTTCATVGEGLAAALAHPDVALCISDFLLPDRTGLEFARELRLFRPGLRIVLASAFLETDLEETVAREPSIALIVRKPLDIFDLKSRVDALLEAAPMARPGEFEAS